jgi:hypothetical protein
MTKWAQRLLEIPYTFMAMNAASVAGLYAFLSKRKNIWVRSSDQDAWESVPAPMVRMPVKRSTKELRKAA